jgi:hypothetical protein
MQSESQQHIPKDAPLLSFSINPSPSLLSSTKPIQHSTTVHTYQPHTAAKMNQDILFFILSTALLFTAVIIFIIAGIIVVGCLELILGLILMRFWG